MTKVAAMRERFAELHRDGFFIMPNAWDAGSARIVASMGFPATATTSSGFAATLGRHDQQVVLDELLAHVGALVGAVDIPVSVDAEHCYGDDPDGVAETVVRIGEQGAAGVSIEDYDPATGILPVDVATARVAAAARAAASAGMVLTARADNHLYGAGGLDDSIDRLRAYQAAGADVLYAPGLTDLGDIKRVVVALTAPVNVLLLRGGPSVPELARAGVRRASTGGALAFTAYGALAAGARELLDAGTSHYSKWALSAEQREAAFGPKPEAPAGT